MGVIKSSLLTKGFSLGEHQIEFKVRGVTEIQLQYKISNSRTRHSYTVLFCCVLAAGLIRCVMHGYEL